MNMTSLLMVMGVVRGYAYVLEREGIDELR